MPAPPPNSESLLSAHADAMRRLARALVHDADRGDDVAQDAALIALERSPRPGASGWAWLAGIVRNAARNLLRGERRRRAHEAAAATPDQARAPTPAEEAERIAELRRVLDAVQRLEPAYRGVVLARFFEGLSIDEIAARDRAPRETVRTRLRRALERLRADLDAHPSGRAWRLALVPFAAAPLGSAAPTAPGPSLPHGSPVEWIGGLAVKKFAVAVAAIFLLAGAIASWRLLGGDERPEDGPAAPTTTERASDDVTLASKPAAPAPRATADDVDLAPIDLSAVDRDLDLHGRVVTADDKPVAGARLEAFVSLDPVPGEEPSKPEATGRSSRDGSFALRLRRGFQVILRASAPGLATTELHFLLAGGRVTVVMEPPVRLLVHVKDAAGKPVAGAAIDVRPVFSGNVGMGETVKNRGGRGHGVTGADGSCAIDGLPPGVLVSATTGTATPSWGSAELPKSGEASLEIAMRASRSIRGTVRDRETEAPIAGASIELWRALATTDADGRFVLASWTGGDAEAIGVRAAGYATEIVRVGAQDELSIALSRGDDVRGRVVAPDGTPIAGAWSAAMGSSAQMPYDYVRADPSTDDGHFVLHGLRRDQSHSVFVSATGRGRAEADVPPRAEGPGVIDLGDVALFPTRRVEGRVLRGGVGVPDTWVTISSGVAADLWVPLVKRRSRITDRRVTDDLGRFRFMDLPSGPYVIEFDVVGETKNTREVVVGDADVLDADFTLTDGVPLVVRVRDASGAPFPLAQVGISQGPGNYRSRQADGEGVARFLVVPGNVTVSIGGMPQRPGRPTLWPEAQRVRYDVGEVVMVLPDARYFGGVVVDESGKPIAHAQMHVEQKGANPWRLATDKEGKFRVVVRPDAPVDVRLTGALQFGDDENSRDGTQPRGIVGSALGVSPDAGEITIRAKVPEGRVLRVRATTPDGHAMPGARLSFTPEHAPVVTGADGSATIDDLLERSYDVRALPPKGDPATAAWLPSAPATATPAGQDVVLALRAGVVVRGAVTDGERPAPDASVEARRGDRVVAKARTDGRGGFVIVADPSADFPMTITATSPDSTRRGSAEVAAPTDKPTTIDLARR